MLYSPSSSLIKNDFVELKRWQWSKVDSAQQDASCTEHVPSVLLYAMWWLLLFSLPLISGFGPPRVVDQVFTPSSRVTVGETEQWLALNHELPLSATAYLLYDIDADQILYAHNQHLALPMASLTKLMTALLIFESGIFDEEVVVQAGDLVGGASMQLVPGEVISVNNLLWGLLVPSGNDAAMALARHNGGTVEAFVERMNERAAALRLAESHFVNPHGLDAEGHVSSVADLLTLTRMLWDYPRFREIVSFAEVTVQGHIMRNTNELLGIYPGANGIKTGTTDAAGQCLVAGFLQDGHQVIAIVLGSNDRYRDMRTLYEHYQTTYRWVEGNTNPFSILNRLYDQERQIWYLRTGTMASHVLLPQVRADQLHPYRRLTVRGEQPWQRGMQVGTVEWLVGNQVVGTQPLFLR